MTASGLRGHLLVLIAGCLLPLSLAPFDIWPMGLVSVMLLIASLEGATPGEGALRGYLYAVGMYAVGVSWIFVSIHRYGDASVPLASLLVAVFVLSFSVIAAAQCFLYVRFIRGGRLGAWLGFASLWVVQEWVRTWILTGFPWLLLGYAYLDHPVGNWAPVAGVMGVSFVAVLTASALYLVIRELAVTGSLSIRGSGAALVTTLLLWGAALALAPVRWVQASADGPIKVSGIQGNIDQTIKWSRSMSSSIFELYRKHSLDLLDSDLVIWPEAAVTMLLAEARPYLDPLAEVARSNGTTLITGIMSADPRSGRYFNSVIALGNGDGIYHKRRLVPFGDYVPLEGQLRGLIQFFDLPMSGTSPGPEQQRGLRAGSLTISASICYEVIYPELVRTSVADPDLLLTISNDTWFGESIGPVQHLQMARMRALENGRYLVRVTNNGISAIVDERGTIKATIPQFTFGVLSGEAEIMTGKTPFSRWGSWPILLICCAALVGQVFLLRPGAGSRISATG